MLAAPSLAGEANDLATKAEDEASKGQHAAALETMRKAMLAVWTKSKLAIRNARFVEKEATGYGIFDPRADNIFKQGESMRVYVEPVGYRWSEENGVFRSNISADVEIKSPEGKILGGQEAVGRFNFASRARNMEYLIQLTYVLPDIPPGKYVVGTTLHDKIGGSSASFDLPFEVK